MPWLTFYYPVLDALSKGPVIRRAVGMGLRGVGVLIALGGLAGIIKLLKLILQPGIPAEATIGGLLLAVLVGAALLCVVQICFYRARSIVRLLDSSYTVVPIVSLAMRAFGEVVGTLGVAAGIGGFFTILLSGPFGAQLLGASGLPSIFFSESSSQSSFVAGLSVLAYAGVMSFAAVLFFYFLAEISVAFVDIARRLEQQTLSGEASSANSNVAKCARCGSAMDSDSEFCEQCGAVRVMVAGT